VVRRLLLTYLTITALTLAAVVIPLGRVFADRERDRLTADIEHDAQAIASLVEDSLESGDPPAIDDVLSDYAGTGGRIVVVDDNGISVADSDELGGAPRDFSTRPEIASALDGARSTGTRPSETLGTGLIYVALPVASGGTVHGAVRITYPTSTLDARVRTMWWRLGLLSAAVLGIVAIVAVVFARGVSRPVRRLQRAAMLLARGDLSVRVDTDDGPPEIRSLAGTFNATAVQLGELIDSQRRFVADASHQLRTPLTALRLRLETLSPLVEPDGQAKLDAAISETNRLARLVHSLLVLARSDATTLEPVATDLTSGVTERVDVWKPVAADQGVRLTMDVSSDVWVFAVPGGLEQILDNLLSNALEVAPEGSDLMIRVAAKGATCDLHVLDQGPGMPAAERARAFERFWRASPAAGRPGGDGFGLGLAIVHELALHSGGSVRLDVGPNGIGLDAVVTLRTAPANRDANPSPPASDAGDVHRTLTSN
jgi:signal transduction histidine kinase